MKSEKEKLAAKSVNALKAAAKRLGGKLVNPDGKAKTKQQLINTIVMKNRLAGKSMGSNAKPTTAKAKPNNAAAAKSIMAQQKKIEAMYKNLEKAYAKYLKTQ
jgi:hypothetical protein